MEVNSHPLFQPDYLYPGSRNTTQTPQTITKGIVRIQIIDRLSRLSAMEEEWDELAQLAGAGIYQRFSWTHTWWHKFGRESDLYIIAFRDGKKLVGVAPFYLNRQWLLGTNFHTTLQFIGTGATGNGHDTVQKGNEWYDVIAHPDYQEEVVGLLLHFLRRSSDVYDEINLQRIGDNSWVKQTLIPRLEDEGWHFKTTSENVCPVLYLNTDAGNEHALENLRERNKQIRAEIRELNGILEHKKICKLSLIHTMGELEYYFPQLVEMHQNNENQQGRPGMFADPAYSLFVLEMFRKLLKKGMLWFTVFKTTGQPLAFNVSFLQGHIVHEHLAASLPDLSIKADEITRFYMLSHAMQNGYHRLNFAETYTEDKALPRQAISGVTLQINGPEKGYKIASRLAHMLRKFQSTRKKTTESLSMFRHRFGLFGLRHLVLREKQTE